MTQTLLLNAADKATVDALFCQLAQDARSRTQTASKAKAIRREVLEYIHIQKDGSAVMTDGERLAIAYRYTEPGRDELVHALDGCYNEQLTFPAIDHLLKTPARTLTFRTNDLHAAVAQAAQTPLEDGSLAPWVRLVFCQHDLSVSVVPLDYRNNQTLTGAPAVGRLLTATADHRLVIRADYMQAALAFFLETEVDTLTVKHSGDPLDPLVLDVPGRFFFLIAPINLD